MNARRTGGKLNQRGIIFTLSVVLLALAVVGLAQTIKENTEKAAQNIEYANTAHAVSAKFQNGVENLVGIEKQFNKLSYSTAADRVTVSDSLPNADYQNSGNIVTLPLAGYKTFVSNYADKYTLTVNEQTGFNNFQLQLKPADVLYTHGVMNSSEAIDVKPPTTSFGHYEVTVNLNGRTYNGPLLDTSVVDPVAGNGVDVVVNVKESTSGSIVKTQTFSNLSATQASTIRVSSTGVSNQTADVTLNLNSGGELVILSAADSTVLFDVATVYGESETKKELAPPMDEWTVKNDLLQMSISTKAINPNDLGNFKFDTYDATWASVKKDYQKGESINYKVSLSNFRGEPIDVSNLRIEVLNPSGATDTLLQNLSTTNGEYKGTFAKSGNSMTAGQWTLKATATKGRTLTATTYFNVQAFEAQCVVKVLDAACSQAVTGYAPGDTGCLAAQLLDLSDNPITPTGIANVSFKPLDGSNVKITLSASYNSAQQRYESALVLATNYTPVNVHHLYAADVSYTKTDGSTDTLHCTKQFWIGNQAEPTLNSLSVTFYDDSALTTLLPVKNQPTEGQDLPTQTQGRNAYIKVLALNAQGQPVNVNNLSLSVTLKNESTPRLALINAQTDAGQYATYFDTSNNPTGRYTADVSATLGSTKSKQEKFYVEQEQCSATVNSFTANFFADAAHTILLTPATYTAGSTVYYDVHAFDAVNNELSSVDQLTIQVKDPNGTVMDTQPNPPAAPVATPFSGSYQTLVTDLPGVWSVDATGQMGVTCQQPLTNSFPFTLTSPPPCPQGQGYCANGTCSVNCGTCTLAQACTTPPGTTCCPGNVCMPSCCPVGQQLCSNGTCQTTCPTTCTTLGTTCSPPTGGTCCQGNPSNVCSLACCPTGQFFCPDGITCVTNAANCPVPPPPASCLQHLWDAPDGSWSSNVTSNKKGIENFKTVNICAGQSVTVTGMSVTWDNPGSEHLQTISLNSSQYYSGSLSSGQSGTLSGSGFALAANTSYAHPGALAWNSKIIGTGGITHRCFTIQYTLSDGSTVSSGQKCFDTTPPVPSTVDLSLYRSSTTAQESGIESATLSDAYDYTTSNPFKAVTVDYYTDASGFPQPIKDYIYKVPIPGSGDNVSGNQTVNRCTQVQDNVFVQVQARDSAGDPVAYDSATITVKNPSGTVVQTITRGASTNGKTQGVIDFGDYDYAKNYETTDYPTTYGSPYADSRWNYNSGGAKDTIVVASKQSGVNANNEGQWIFDAALRNHPYGTMVYTTNQTKYNGFIAYNPVYKAENTDSSLIKTGDFTVDVSVTAGQTTVTSTKKFKLDLPSAPDARFTDNCAVTVSPPAPPKPYFVIEYDDNPQYSHLDAVMTTPKGLQSFNEGDKVYYRVTVKDYSTNPAGKLTLSDAYVKIAGGSSATGGYGWLTSASQCAALTGENWMDETASTAAMPAGTSSYFTDPNRLYYGQSFAEGDWQWQTTLRSSVYLDKTKTGVTVDNSGQYATIKGWFKIPKPNVVEYGTYESYTTTNQGYGKMCNDYGNSSMNRQPISSNLLLLRDPAGGQNYYANPPYTYDAPCSRQINLHNPLNAPMSKWPRVVDSCAGTYYPLVSVKVSGGSSAYNYRALNDSIKTQGAGNYFYAKTWDKQAECFNIEWMGAKSLWFGPNYRCVDYYTYAWSDSYDDDDCVAWARWNNKHKTLVLKNFAVYNNRYPKVAYGSGSLDCVADSLELKGFTPHLSGTGTDYGGVGVITLWKNPIWKTFQIYKHPTYEGNNGHTLYYCEGVGFTTTPEGNCTAQETDETSDTAADQCAEADSDDPTDWTDSCTAVNYPTGPSPTAKDGETHFFYGYKKIKDLVKVSGNSYADTCSLKNAIVLFIRTSGNPVAKNLGLALDSIDFTFSDDSVYKSHPTPQKNCTGWGCWYNYKDSAGAIHRNANYCIPSNGEHAHRK